MKQILHVEVNDYNIEISDNEIEILMSDMNSFTAKKRRLFVISKRVYKLYKKEFALNKDEVLILPDGEKEKNYKNYLKIIEKAYELGLTRGDIFIAVGGGVIGDITGFAAATYMRGIDYIQVPTTLLAMVDSSVGGKTAINLADGKNIIGAFHQPKAVFINTNFLKTLHKKELKSGIGEILKYAFIEESCSYKEPLYLFEYLTLCCEKFLAFDPVTVARIIDYALKLKISVVEKDEKEANLRKILNLGHTLGHALEEITNYRKFKHGEAVVYGIFFTLYIAYKYDFIDYSYYRLSLELLGKYGFKNIDIAKTFDTLALLNLMKKDKKSTKDNIILILPHEKKRVKEFKFTEDELFEYLNNQIPNF